MEIIGIIVVFIIIFAVALLYGAVSWGLVMYKFWGWFLLPVFPSLPSLTFAQAMGLAVFIGLFHTVQTQVIKKEYKDELQGLLLPIVAPWVTLFFGWIIWLVIY